MFTVSIRHLFSSFSKAFHYVVTLSELFLLDMFDQHGSPVCVCLCVHRPLGKQLHSIFSAGGCVGMPGMSLKSLGNQIWHPNVY